MPSNINCNRHSSLQDWSNQTFPIIGLCNLSKIQTDKCPWLWEVTDRKESGRALSQHEWQLKTCNLPYQNRQVEKLKKKNLPWSKSDCLHEGKRRGPMDFSWRWSNWYVHRTLVSGPAWAGYHMTAKMERTLCKEHPVPVTTDHW